MKTCVILMLTVLAATVPCRAQQHRSSSLASAHRLTDRQTRLLGLSDSQVQRMGRINQAFFHAKDSLNHTRDLAPSSRIAAFHQVLDRRDAAYRNVLSSTQYRTWNDWELQHRKKLKQKKLKHSGHPLIH